ncbi:DUF3995 domain-containing protein [Actinomadura sp. ATCC 39365]|uniref:DUF3995 domain-containing protein n=1 Tax=Nonomuraea sp. NPDC005692 TaxID=3157168 RepID=UPI00340EED41
MNISRLGALTASILLTDAAAHLYWLTGRTWPAHDVGSLSLAVLNFEVPFTPRVLVPLVVVLGTGAAAVLACSRGRGGLPARLITAAVTAGTLVRAAAGLVWIAGVGADTATPFYWLNLFLYTPLCVVMAAAAAVVAARRGSRRL